MSEIILIVWYVVEVIVIFTLTLFIYYLWERYKKKKGKDKMLSDKTKNLIVIYVWIGLTIAGIITSIWIWLAFHWIYALMVGGIWGFFLISPFIDWESRDTAQRDRVEKARKKHKWKQERGWE